MNRRPSIASLLDGLVDMHVHSGPSPFPRRFDHVEAARDGARIGLRARVAKSHHHNTQMDLLAMKDRLADVAADVYGGIALNSTVGGLNVHAVRMCLRMGGKVVWFPTISSGRHLECHPEDGSFPTTTVPLTSQLALTARTVIAGIIALRSTCLVRIRPSESPLARATSIYSAARMSSMEERSDCTSTGAR